MPTPHTIDQLRKAVQISEQIMALETELAAIFTESAKAFVPVKVEFLAEARKSKFSAAHRAKLAAAAKARWAKKNAAKTPTSAPAKAAPAPKKKQGGISPEGLARIKAAQKLRWAKFRKGM